MVKPSLCVALAALIACSAEQVNAQTGTAQQLQLPTIAAFTGSRLESVGYPVMLVAVTKPFTDFVLISHDGQRKIGFSLDKNSDGAKMTWTIIFMLYERKAGSDLFGNPIISLNVVIDASLSAKAQIVTQYGLTASQAAHATGPAANSAEAFANGSLSYLAAATSIQNTLK